MLDAHRSNILRIAVESRGGLVRARRAGDTRLLDACIALVREGYLEIVPLGGGFRVTEQGRAHVERHTRR